MKKYIFNFVLLISMAVIPLFSQNDFAWYSIVYGEEGEEIGLQEISKPEYGIPLVVIAKTPEADDGDLIDIAVYEETGNFKVEKTELIINGEVKLRCELGASRYCLEKLKENDKLYYKCTVKLPDGRIKESPSMEVIFIHEIEFWNSPIMHVLYILESDDGVYSQIHDPIIESMPQGDHAVLKFINIIPGKKYTLKTRDDVGDNVIWSKVPFATLML